MKTVTLTKDMRPWRAGDDVPLPNALARTLVESGEAKNMRPFNPGGTADPAAERPANAYITKGKRT